MAAMKLYDEINSYYFLKILIIDFDEKIVKYPFSNSDDLMLGYALTIHRSQGSQYPVCIVIMSNHHYSMLEKKLLYTAATRSQKMLVFISSWSAMKRSVENNDVSKRNSFLSFRLRSLLNTV